jgi:hypothetical protein
MIVTITEGRPSARAVDDPVVLDDPEAVRLSRREIRSKAAGERVHRDQRKGIIEALLQASGGIVTGIVTSVFDDVLKGAQCPDGKGVALTASRAP